MMECLVTTVLMPAINPERLKRDVAELSADFSDPEKFVRQLEDLLDRYADRVRRPRQTGAPAPLLPAFQVAPPVMRQIMLTLTPLAEADSLAAFALADALWEKPSLETRQLAIRLVGLIPAADPVQILARLQKWAKPEEEEHILEELFSIGLSRLQNRYPEQLLDMIGEWMGHSRVELQTLGARALLPLVENPAFDNLPLVYRMLLPSVIDSLPVLRAHLASVVRVLAERSPQETAHFLNQILIVTDNPGPAWITRRAMELFPEEMQERLKETIRNR